MQICDIFGLSFLPTLALIIFPAGNACVPAAESPPYVKMNMKGLYNQFQCQICDKEEESQIHIYESNKIWEIRNKNMSNKNMK